MFVNDSHAPSPTLPHLVRVLSLQPILVPYPPRLTPNHHHLLPLAANRTTSINLPGLPIIRLLNLHHTIAPRLDDLLTHIIIPRDLLHHRIVAAVVVRVRGEHVAVVVVVVPRDHDAVEVGEDCALAAVARFGVGARFDFAGALPVGVEVEAEGGGGGGEEEGRGGEELGEGSHFLVMVMSLM